MRSKIVSTKVSASFFGRPPCSASSSIRSAFVTALARRLQNTRYSATDECNRVGVDVTPYDPATDRDARGRDASATDKRVTHEVAGLRKRRG